MYGKLSVTRRMGERGPLASYSVCVLSVCSIKHVPAAADSCVICSGCVCAVCDCFACVLRVIVRPRVRVSGVFVIL
jgi:hypothetical protein